MIWYLFSFLFSLYLLVILARNGMVPTAVGERKLMDLAHSLGVGHGCLV